MPQWCDIALARELRPLFPALAFDPGPTLPPPVGDQRRDPGAEPPWLYCDAGTLTDRNIHRSMALPMLDV